MSIQIPDSVEKDDWTQNYAFALSLGFDSAYCERYANMLERKNTVFYNDKYHHLEDILENTKRS